MLLFRIKHVVTQLIEQGNVSFKTILHDETAAKNKMITTADFHICSQAVPLAVSPITPRLFRDVTLVDPPLER